MVACLDALTGAAGAALGAGLVALIRNTGGAVTAVVGLLFVVPPVLVQLTPDMANWIPSTPGVVDLRCGPRTHGSPWPSSASHCGRWSRWLPDWCRCSAATWSEQVPVAPKEAVMNGSLPARRIRSWVVVGALLAGFALLPLAATADTGPAVDDVTAVLADQLHAAGIPGGAYVVATADGTVTARGTGTTGVGDAVTPDTPFVIGSTTKSFTALAVMQLVDAGKVSLDAPVTRYVPDLRAGRRRTGRCDHRAAGAAADERSRRPDRRPHPGLGQGGIRTRSGRGAPLRPAGVRARAGTWRYANANYVLAGLVVEQGLLGRTYADYLRDERSWTRWA